MYRGIRIVMINELSSEIKNFVARHKRIIENFIIIGFIFGFLKVQAQVKDSIYVKEVKGFCKLIDSTVENNEPYNMTIAFTNKEFKYGKWKFFYDNGTLKSEGFIVLKRITGWCGTEPIQVRYEEKRIGKWQYWSENGKPRTDLIHPEIPYEGDYRVFDRKKRVLQEGTFKNGELITGKKYTYLNGPNYAIGIDSYRNGKYLGKNWK